jgi:phosphate starvation-inducible protein PhoH
MNRAQFQLVFSRMCRQAKIVVTGDPLQCDIYDSFLEKAIEAVRPIDRVCVIEFSEQENERHGLVPQVLRAFAGAA